MSKKIKLDPRNFNKHTEKGMELLEKSISEVGAIESVTVDKNGEIITGNARQETFVKLGYKPKFIELEENEYPVIQTQLEGERRIKAAILANTVGKHNLNFDNDLIQEVAVEGIGIDIEELGLEVIQGKELGKPKTLDTIPYEKTHILISFPPDKLFEIQEELEKIKEKSFIEYEQSSN